MSEVSQSLHFQWLVSAHRAFRHAGREITLRRAMVTVKGPDELVGLDFV
jgi:hypothetical protein